MGSVLEATERATRFRIVEDFGRAVPTIVPVARQNRPFLDNGSQVARSAKCLKRLDLLGKPMMVERQISV
jgi:hypothetical protein